MSEPCTECEGRRVVTRAYANDPNEEIECPHCDGTGLELPAPWRSPRPAPRLVRRQAVAQ